MDVMIEWLDAHPICWPMFIILARVMDVSIGTIRTIVVVRGYRVVAGVLGFFEVTIWVLAVSGVLREVTWVKLLAYGTGFGLGNIVGIRIEQALALGNQMVMMISRGRNHGVAFALRLADYAVTEVPAKGRSGEVAMCFTVVPRDQVAHVTHIAKAVDENTFIVVEDLRTTHFRHRPTAVPATGWRAIIKKK